MTIVARKKRNRNGLLAPVVDKNMKSYRDDPFFVKKAQKAKELIEKYGLPSEELRRSKPKTKR